MHLVPSTTQFDKRTAFVSPQAANKKSAPAASCMIGVDSGGTFTDIAALGPGSQVFAHGVITGIRRWAKLAKDGNLQ